MNFIEAHQLKPVKLVNTHAHVDHICGNGYIADRYHLPLYLHKLDEEILERGPQQGLMFGIKIAPSPAPTHFMEEGQQLTFGTSSLDILFTPGHSPGHVCFYSAADGFVIGGDVLFERSIGRTDLYKGDYPTLEKSIREKLYVLPDETVVYPGHGNPTRIGDEKRHNPFVNQL